jgi:quinol monooxygenase YgiN
MITVLFYATVKEGQVQAFHDHVVRLTAITRAEDDGCLTYVFHQRQDNPREFMLYEQWRDEASLDAHVTHCQVVFGPPGRTVASQPPSRGCATTSTRYAMRWWPETRGVVGPHP